MQAFSKWKFIIVYSKINKQQLLCILLLIYHWTEYPTLKRQQKKDPQGNITENLRGQLTSMLQPAELQKAASWMKASYPKYQATEFTR